MIATVLVISQFNRLWIAKPREKPYVPTFEICAFVETWRCGPSFKLIYNNDCTTSGYIPILEGDHLQAIPMAIRANQREKHEKTKATGSYGDP